MDDADSSQSAPSPLAAGPSLLDQADAVTLRAVFQLTPTFLSITGLDDGRLLDVNEAFVEITGYARSEVLGRPVGELDLWVDPAQRERALAALQRGEPVRGVEARFRMKGGEERVMLLSGEIMTLGGRRCAVTVLTDITDRTRAEEARQESERRFAQLFHANPLPMTITRLGDGRHLDVNEAAVRHTGFARDEMLGRTGAELGVWVTDDHGEPMLEPPTGLGSVRDREAQLRVRDGDLRRILVNREVIAYAGQPAVLTVALDITERKLVEAQSEARREEAEALAEAAHLLARSLDLSVVADEIVNRVRRLIRSNAALLALLDPDTQHLTVQSISGAVGPLWKPGMDIPRGASLSWRAIQEGRVVTATELLTDPWIRWTPEMRARVEAAGYRAGLAAPLVVNARVVGTLSVGDEAGRIYADKEVRLVRAFASHAAVAVANARLFRDVDTANRGKDEFLAMLGHELRNPLGTITNAVSVLDLGATDDRTRHLSGIIRRQTQRLARLVDDLLDVARVTSGKIVIERRPVDLREVAARCLEALAQSGRSHEHSVSLAGAPALVEGDAARLEQVVANLLDNAIKYTPAGGRVSVSTSRVGADAVLQVSDSGSGIRADILPRVFDLFTQEPQALDRSRGGLGLGLALVKRLVELHGGTVTAASPGPGRGSELTVRLPARVTSVDPEPARGGAAAREARRRILIVEDDADAREALRQMLALAGHDVVEADDGVQALEQLVAQRPDIALIDVGLPRLDGYAVAERTRQRDETRAVFLVALTGYGQAEDRRRALEAGFDRHLTKPVDRAVLEDLIRSAPPRRPA